MKRVFEIVVGYAVIVMAAMASGQTVGVNDWRELIVVVRSNGRPVSNAEVDFGLGRSPTHTDDTGQVRYGWSFPPFPSADDAAIRLHIPFQVRAPGFAAEHRHVDFAGSVETVFVDLVAETPLAGRVLDPSGRPVEGVVVTIRPEEWLRVRVRTADFPDDDTISRSRTDDAGRFMLTGVASGRRYFLAAAPPPELSMARTEVAVVGGPRTFDVTLPEAGEILLEGEFPPEAESAYNPLAFERPAGAPTPISLQRIDPLSGRWQPAFASLDVEEAELGRFRIRLRQVQPGLIRVVTGDWSSRIAPNASEPFPVLAGAVTPVKLRLVFARSLQLRVIDENGVPVAGARLTWTIPDFLTVFTDTDREGNATINVHPEQDVRLVVSGPERTNMEWAIPAGVGPQMTIVVPALRER